MVTNSTKKHIKNIFIFKLEIIRTSYRLFNNNEQKPYGGYIS